MADSKTDVAVLGAGIVGVSAAYAARQRGLSVVLVDRREPGGETSYGNAGILSSGSISPLNNPSLWSALPKYLTNQNAALRWNIGWAVRNPDWVIRFLANATNSRLRPRAITGATSRNSAMPWWYEDGSENANSLAGQATAPR